MTVVEAVWTDVLSVLVTGTFWAMAVGAILASMLMARLMAAGRIRRDEEPVAASRATWTLSSMSMFVVFLAVAYALDTWSVGVVVAGAVFVAIVPLLLAHLLARPVDEAGAA